MIDLLLLALIAVSALLGLMRGMLAAVFGVLSWLLASWAALRFGRDATLFISGGDAPTLAQYATGHAVAFFAVLLAVTGVGLLLRGVVNATVLLKGPDRLLGLVLGTVRGVLLAVLAVLVLGFTPLAEGEDWRRSQVRLWLQAPADWLRGWLPDLSAMRDQALLDLGKTVLAGDNAALNEQETGSGLPRALPETGENAGPEAARDGRQAPAKASPSTPDPAQVRPDHPGPARAGPSGQARPPSR